MSRVFLDYNHRKNCEDAKARHANDHKKQHVEDAAFHADGGQQRPLEILPCVDLNALGAEALPQTRRYELRVFIVILKSNLYLRNAVAQIVAIIGDALAARRYIANPVHSFRSDNNRRRRSDS